MNNDPELLDGLLRTINNIKRNKRHQFLIARHKVTVKSHEIVIDTRELSRISLHYTNQACRKLQNGFELLYTFPKCAVFDDLDEFSACRLAFCL